MMTPYFEKMSMTFLPCSCLPCLYDMIHNFFYPDLMLHLCEDKWPPISHPKRISLHDSQVSPNCLCKVSLVYHKEISLRDSRTTFPRNFITTRHIYYVNNIVSQFPAKIGSQVISPRFTKKYICFVQV
uniref:Uncharacterized protein n=1 Tax=Lotus japonicus TaxID=34305 RepID=I3S718_LOTJA|nr:unknown [Lotus japonicus]